MNVDGDGGTCTCAESNEQKLRLILLQFIKL